MSGSEPEERGADGGSPLAPWLRGLLVCPRCRGELQDVAGGLRCDADALVYPVVDGVPWLIESAARADAR